MEEIRFVISHFPFFIGGFKIEVQLDLVIAPEERDVYSTKTKSNYLAP